MKKISNFIYVTVDKDDLAPAFASIGTNFTCNEKESKMIRRLDQDLRKLIAKCENKLNT